MKTRAHRALGVLRNPAALLTEKAPSPSTEELSVDRNETVRTPMGAIRRALHE